MCERTCPVCRATSHFHGYGITGSYIVCDGCGTTLAHRRDEQAAPLDLQTDDEVDRWCDEGTFVLPGAEAKNPSDDVIWTPGRTHPADAESGGE